MDFSGEDVDEATKVTARPTELSGPDAGRWTRVPPAPKVENY
jgi:hypothetical protein